MKRTFLGIGLILLAGFLLFQEQLGLAYIPVWTILWITFLGGCAIVCLLKRSWFAGLACLILALSQLNSIFHWYSISSWLLFLVAMLVIGGLKLIFKPKYKSLINWNKSERIRIEKKWTASEERTSGRILSGESMDLIFGNSTVYFEENDMVGETATYEVNAIFSSVILYVPSTWKVAIKGDQVFSKVNQEPSHLDCEKTLVINADMVFSNLTIMYL